MIGGQNVFKWCRSRDQDGHHVHIRLNPLNISSLESNGENGDLQFFFIKRSDLLAGKQLGNKIAQA